MLKLKLDNIKKTYNSGETVTALKGVSMGFRKSEFVSILGPSGCGKTTLLNIIGGLDRYNSGDLIINGMSTKKFKASDWDAYRNSSIGFVFQSYNLIGHQTVLQNVEIALTLSGVSATERKRRAKKALADVGLSDQLKKNPNQLSGGQMQRVAIARALVNDPDIILADEPTGALDSHTSVQIMDILKEVAKTRLVIMVTHNGDLAEEYSNRIIRLMDGEIQSDSNPIAEDEAAESLPQTFEKKKLKKTSMSLRTATALSFRNLLTKKGRTIITAFAGSIGIIGVALVLALSNGLSSYMSNMQSSTLSGFPITISSTAQSVTMGAGKQLNQGNAGFTEFPSNNVLYSYDKNANSTTHTNILSQDYLNYIGKIQTALPDSVNNISYTRGVTMNVLAKYGDSVVQFNSTANGNGQMQQMQSNFGVSTTYWQELPANQNFSLSMYDLIGDGSRMPKNKNEVVLVVDQYNRIDKAFLDKIGMSDTANYKLSDFIGKTIFTVVDNNDYYTKNGNMYTAATPSDYDTLYNNNGVKLTIVGILREKKDASSSYLSEGIAYTPALADYVMNSAKNSNVAQQQKTSNSDVTTGALFTSDTAKTLKLQSLGADTTPTGINIYPKDYAAKDKIKTYLDNYNTGKSETTQVIYTDMAETIANMTSKLLNTVTYVLTGFAAISLIVSTIMIGIITYVSVIERTKEIGILRSVGARKKDISRVFNAETLIIGFTAGMLGVGISYLLTIPINIIIKNLVGISGIANLSITSAGILVLGSMVLTLIAGFLPSRMAANKDPVIALRSE